jgi:hypothetical protein
MSERRDDDDDRELRQRLRQLGARTPSPSEDFTGAVMRRAALRPAPRRSFWQAWWAPRELTIRVRPAGLVGSFALAVIVLAAGARLWPRAPTLARAPGELPATATATLGTPPATAPTNEVLVRFSLRDADARHVGLAGDFNGWRPDALPLTRGPDGTWSATVPLPHGSWSYSFVVDGKWVSDPSAEAWRDDGFGGRNAVVRIGS